MNKGKKKEKKNFEKWDCDLVSLRMDIKAKRATEEGEERLKVSKGQ